MRNASVLLVVAGCWRGGADPADPAHQKSSGDASPTYRVHAENTAQPFVLPYRFRATFQQSGAGGTEHGIVSGARQPLRVRFDYLSKRGNVQRSLIWTGSGLVEVDIEHKMVRVVAAQHPPLSLFFAAPDEFAGVVTTGDVQELSGNGVTVRAFVEGRHMTVSADDGHSASTLVLRDPEANTGPDTQFAVNLQAAMFATFSVASATALPFPASP